MLQPAHQVHYILGIVKGDIFRLTLQNYCFLRIPVGLGRDADAGFEEAVEECHIVKAEA